MTVYRRLKCLAVALCLMITLIPSATGTLLSARADGARYGITHSDNGKDVHTRIAPNDKIAFDLPVNYVAEILDAKVVDKVTWYKIKTYDPSRNNYDIHHVYVHGDFFRELTAEEIAQYQKNNSIATPTPIPTSNGSQPTPTPTPSPAGKNEDLPAIEGSIGVVTAGGTNFREGPSTGDHSITRLDRNTQVELLTIPTIVGDSKTFYKVRYNGTVGYIMSNFIQVISGGAANGGTSVVVTPTPTYATGLITPTPVPSGDALGYVRTTKGGCNLRATISGTVIKQIAKNVTLPYILEPVKKNGYTWYFVVDGDNRGYLRSDVVRVVSAPAPTAEPTATPTAAPTSTSAPVVTPTPTPTPAPTQEPTGYLKTTAGGVNLRVKAGYSDPIGYISKNVVMPYYGEPTKIKGVYWYKVTHPKLGTGYVHADFIIKCNADGSALATPTPAPTPTPEPGTTAAPTASPNGGQQEASYTTLKTGSTGNAVKNLVTELKNQGYYSGTVTNKYTTAVAEAVRAFQRAKGLTVDGVAGAATQHKLYGTVPIGAGDTSNLTMTLYPAEKIDWYTGGINEMWAKGSNYKVYDVKTGIVWWAHRWAGGLHVDAEPLTAADTARLCRCYGVSTSQEIASKNLYQRRPLLVTIGSRTFACSLYGVPHNYPEGDTISTNDFKGQVCIHFTNSKTHNSNKVDSGHEEAIDYAWKNAPNGHK